MSATSDGASWSGAVGWGGAMARGVFDPQQQRRGTEEWPAAFDYAAGEYEPSVAAAWPPFRFVFVRVPGTRQD